MIGTSVDRYDILEELGHGGMSVVYRGLDSSLEREVAVKVLHNHLAKKLENRRRFHREAKAIARLRHPNILEVYDFSSEDEARSYIVMEYIAGENLRQFVARTQTPPPEIAALFGVEICNALEHAHDHGIIHRDLKPENVMVSSGGDVKLMDFGIAHVIDAETMTATGSLMGSPAHMPPELIDGEKVDVRADVFALGTVLYWLATGALPFDGANAPQVLKRVLAGDYDEIDVVEPRVGRRMGAIIERCLAHSPADRYPTVAAVRKELAEFANAIGIADERTELKRYIKDPDKYRAEFGETIVTRLMALANEAETERDLTGAIAICNRILAYDPSNKEVQRLLDRLCSQDRWRRLAVPVGVGLLAIGAVFGWQSLRPPDPEPPAPIVKPPPVEKATDNTAALIATSTEVAELEAAERVRSAFDDSLTKVTLAHAVADRVANDRQPPLVPLQPLTAIARPMVVKSKPDMGTPDMGEPEPLPSHIWKFKISPAAATFTIDEKRIDPMLASSGIPLTEGSHLLRVESKGTAPMTRRINVTKPGELSIALQWLPATVEVQSNIDAVVWFDKSALQKMGTRRVFKVPFGPADSTENQRRITVQAADAHNMGKRTTKYVDVVAGSRHPVLFTFEKKTDP